MSEKKPTKQGYKLFIVRGLWLKAGKPMPFEDFCKSDMLKKLAKERLNAEQGTQRDEKLQG